MKKREFQKKATAELFKKLVEVCAELGENPNITVSSKYNSSYFKLRKNYNLIQISVKQTGELSYQLTDMLRQGWKGQRNRLNSRQLPREKSEEPTARGIWHYETLTI